MSDASFHKALFKAVTGPKGVYNIVSVPVLSFHDRRRTPNSQRRIVSSERPGDSAEGESHCMGLSCTNCQAEPSSPAPSTAPPTGHLSLPTSPFSRSARILTRRPLPKQPRHRPRLDHLALVRRRADRLRLPPAPAIRPPPVQNLPALLRPPVPLRPRPSRPVLSPTRRGRARSYLLALREQDCLGPRGHGHDRPRQLARRRPRHDRYVHSRGARSPKVRLLIILPPADVMKERHRRERSEGKSYDEPNVRPPSSSAPALEPFPPSAEREI